MNNDIKYLGSTETFTDYQNIIVDEFFEKNRRNIGKFQKQLLRKYQSNLFNLDDLLKDRCVFIKQFKSKITKKNYIMVESPCNNLLFEC
jgi:hypothetical protein